jgi:VCBS repeat-containing protein
VREADRRLLVEDLEQRVLLATYADTVLADSPAAYYQLSDAGPAAVDAANGLDGTFSGGVTFGVAGVSGDLGAGVVVNGSNGKADIPHNPTLNPAGSFSVELWARVDGGSGHRSPITSRDDISGGADTRGYILYATPSNVWQFWTGSGGTGGGWNVLSGPGVVNGEWTHFVLTFEADGNGRDGNGAFHGTKTMYVNGLQAAQAAGFYEENNVEALHIGAGSDAGNNFYFNGAIDDVSIYGSSLSAADAAGHYAAGLIGDDDFSAIAPTNEDSPVNVSAGSNGVYDFDISGNDGADLDGWSDVIGQSFPAGTVFGNAGDAGGRATGGGGNGSGNQDSSHPSMIMRSPSFELTTGDQISFQIAGGQGGATLPTNVSQIPANSATNGAQGVGLRRASDNEYLLTARRSGNANNYQSINWNSAMLDPIAAANAGENFTLDFFDYYNGSWGFAMIDNVVTPPSGSQSLGLNDTAGSVILAGNVTSTNGAAVAVSADGSFSYDPSAAAPLQALGEGEVLIDTFDYSAATGVVPPSGRFIRVENNGGGTRRMDIGEIEAFAPGVVPAVDNAGGSGALNPGTDLATPGNGASLEAKGAISGFSQPHGGDDDGRLMDGAETTGGGTWSSNGVGNFVIIDLGSSKEVETVRVHQRNDGCCQDRLRDITISLLADSGGSPGAVVDSVSFSAQPANNSFAEVTFTSQLSGIQDEGTVSIEVTGINDAPIGVDDANSIDELANDVATANTATGDVFANDIDVDDTAATFTLSQVSRVEGGVFDFDVSGNDGLDLDGWVDVIGESFNGATVFNNAGDAGGRGTGGGGNGSGNQDSSHPSLIMRSPAFSFGAENNISFGIAGGQGGGTLPTNVSQVPANSTTSGAQGVGLRRDSDDAYVLTARRAGNANSYQTINWNSGTLNPIAAANPGETFTLDYFDFYHGGWGFAMIDNVDISAATPDTSGSVDGIYGTLTWNPTTAGDGDYTYTLDDANPAVQALGEAQTLTDTFLYEMSDNHAAGNPLGSSASLSIEIQGINDAPDASDNTAAVTEDTGLTDTGNLLTDDDGNGADSDVDNDDAALTVASVGGVTDPNTNVVGTLGTLDWATAGSYTYTLDNANPAIQALPTGLTATDTFTYDAQDDALAPNVGRFVRVQNNGGASRRMDIGEIEVFAAGVSPSVDHVGGQGALNPGTDLATLANGAVVHSQTTNQPHGFNNTTVINGTENTGAMWSTNGVGNFVIIDLGSSQVVETVRVHQRNDGCCQDRLRDFTVTLLADDGAGQPGAVLASGVFATQPANNSFGEIVLPPGPDFATGTGSLVATVTGINDAPVAVNDTGTTTNEITVATVDVLANDTDVDSNDDASNFTVDSIDSVVTDGASAVTVGNFAIVGNQVEFSPSPTFSALDLGDTETVTVTYTMSDNEGATSTATATIAVTGLPNIPVANDDAVGIGEDDSATIDVVANDDFVTAIQSLDTTGTVGTVTHDGATVNYDTAGQFDSLADGVTATDTFSYTVIGTSVETDTATVTVTITGANDAPVPSVGGPYTISEGDDLTLDASGTTDLDAGASLTYAWDLNGDGVYGDATGATPTVTWATLNALSPAVDDGPATFDVSVQVDDGFGGVNSATAVLTVDNAAPTALLSGPAETVSSIATSFVISASDPAPGDDAAGFTYSINWGDGSSVETIGPGAVGTQNLTHSFPLLGTFTVSVTTTDKDGGSDTVTSDIDVVPVAKVGNDVIVGGTPGGDRIIVQLAQQDSIFVRFNNLRYGSFDVTPSTIVFISGGAGNDRISIGSCISTVIDGGVGNDSINGGSCDDVISGGDGKDVILGGEGDNNIDGGAGNDTILTRSGDDFIDGGFGNDFISGGAGRDLLFGGIGNDRINGGRGADLLSGGIGNDILNAGDNHDVIVGNDGNDRLNGGNGDDLLVGGFDRDSIHGNRGRDTLIGASAQNEDSVTALDALLLDWSVGRVRDGLGTLTDDGDIDAMAGGGGSDTVFDGADDLSGARNNDSLLTY